MTAATRTALTTASTILTAVVLATTVLPAREPLRLDVYTADASSYHVTSALIYGPTEAILVDAQFRNSDAARLADRVAATNTHLKAIFVTHPHPDHYLGLTRLLERFPATPVYMTAAGLDEFKRTVVTDLPRLQATLKSDAPAALPDPQVLPGPHLEVDGQSVDVRQDWQGDVLRPTNSWVWIPSLRAAIAGDLVFDHVHVWLPESNRQTRAAWNSALRRLDSMHPRLVIAGHTDPADRPNHDRGIAFTRDYLQDFESARRASSGPDDLVARMKQKYAGVALEGILVRGAQAAFQK